MTSTLRRLQVRTIGRVIAIRRPHPSPPTTDSPESQLLSEVGDVFQLAIPVVQAVVGVIPVVGTPLGAAVNGLLQIIQAIDVGHMFCIMAFLLIVSQTTKRNKAALDDLASRLHRLLEFLSHEPEPRDELDASRRTALTLCVFMLKSFSMTDDIARSDVSKTPLLN
jgi:hypothetical protein